MRLIWFGKVKFWAINSGTLKETGCKNKVNEKDVFDIHVESPAYDIDGRRFVSVMINVEGNFPDSPEVFDIYPKLNKNPIYSSLKDIPFNIHGVCYLETSSFTTMHLDDCIWLHYFPQADGLGTQIVPNRIDFSVNLIKHSLFTAIKEFFK